MNTLATRGYFAFCLNKYIINTCKTLFYLTNHKINAFKYEIMCHLVVYFVRSYKICTTVINLIKYRSSFISVRPGINKSKKIERELVREKIG